MISVAVGDLLVVLYGLVLHCFIGSTGGTNQCHSIISQLIEPNTLGWQGLLSSLVYPSALMARVLRGHSTTNNGPPVRTEENSPVDKIEVLRIYQHLS